LDVEAYSEGNPVSSGVTITVKYSNGTTEVHDISEFPITLEAGIYTLTADFGNETCGPEQIIIEANQTTVWKAYLIPISENLNLLAVVIIPYATIVLLAKLYLKRAQRIRQRECHVRC